MTAGSSWTHGATAAKVSRLHLGNAGAARGSCSSQHMSSQRPPPRGRPVRWLQQQWPVALLLQACLLAVALTAASAQSTTAPPATSSSAALSTAEATADRKLALVLLSTCNGSQRDPEC